MEPALVLLGLLISDRPASLSPCEAVGRAFRAKGRQGDRKYRRTGSVRLDCAETHPEMPRGSRSSYRIANRFSAAFQSCTGRVHFLATRSRAKNSSFMAASSFGNEPRVLITFRRLIFSDSTALVV